MNRFKFRVWDEENKKFLETERCFIDGNGNFTYKDSQGIANYWTSDFIIEHSTGLTDKNGKEIFEGDMLIYEGDISGEVCYDYNRACFCMKWDDGENTLFQKYWDYNDIEITGNIHEVPHE